MFPFILLECIISEKKNIGFFHKGCLCAFREFPDKEGKNHTLPSHDHGSVEKWVCVSPIVVTLQIQPFSTEPRKLGERVYKFVCFKSNCLCNPSTQNLSDLDLKMVSCQCGRVLPGGQWWPDPKQCDGGLVGQPMGSVLYYVVTWKISPYPMRIIKGKQEHGNHGMEGSQFTSKSTLRSYTNISFCNIRCGIDYLLLPSWNYSTCKWLVWTSLLGRLPSKCELLVARSIWYVT